MIHTEEGLSVLITRGDDGKIVVELMGPEDEKDLKNEEPDIRIWLNEELIYEVK